MGEMQKTVTGIKLDKQQGMIILVAAIFASGWASIIAGVLTTNESEKKPAIIIGICQILTNWIFGLGWFWSVYNGYTIYKNSQWVWPHSAVYWRKTSLKARECPPPAARANWWRDALSIHNINDEL